MPLQPVTAQVAYLQSPTTEKPVTANQCWPVLLGGLRDIKIGVVTKCSPVYEIRESHESKWAAIEAVASKIGRTAQTLSNWIRKASAPTSPPRLLMPASRTWSARFAS